MKKILLVFIINFLLCFGVNAETEKKEVKDCFEGVNRATFAFNQGLDKAIFKPLAKGYRALPSPIRTGTGNVVSNLSNLITIPNNLLQGDFHSAGINTARLAVVGEDPLLLSGQDPNKVSRANKATSIAAKPAMERITRFDINWNLISWPGKAWAKQIFPELDPDNAQKKLADAIFTASRSVE